METSRIRAWLAVLAYIGFLICLYLLFVQELPQGAKDIILIVIGAQITLVKDVYSYFFGSSSGSTQKTALLAAANPPNNGGFARLQILYLLAISALFALLLAGCVTTDTPRITTGKTLLSVKATIVTTAQTADTLCKQGTLKPDTCAQAKAAYEMSKPAYDSAVDAYLLGRSTDYDAALQRLQAILQNMLLLTAPRGDTGGQ